MSADQPRTNPIGVFDSGIGGLTVVHALTKRLPNENIVYFGDTARVPYGPKSPQVIREYTAQDTAFLTGNNVKFIVVACNTVSSVALDIVTKHSHVPVVGMIAPAAVAAVAASRNKRIGIIGTAATIASGAYEHAVHRADPSALLLAKACPLFVPLVEEGMLEHHATELIAREYLFPLKGHKIDTLILGCTHYPLLRKAIEKVFDDSITLIDTGEAAAVEVERMLEERDLKNPSTMRGNIQFFVSDETPKFAEIGERFLGQTLGKVRTVRLAD
ncbi:MAG TPA: glutamate racemase [Bacteroidota bacterium]|nr:glutamate racemase [Bacteroidota bacterium]